MPTGRVKWFSMEKGFGFISSDEGEDVYLASSALPSGVTTVKPGTKVEFGIAEGRRGPQALSVRVVEAPPSISGGRGAEDLAILIEESIKMLDRVGNNLRHGRPLGEAESARVAKVLRGIAGQIEGTI
ncbi:MAG: hypothetical protein RLZZ394_83 [Actinomycetota bacterium]